MSIYEFHNLKDDFFQLEKHMGLMQSSCNLNVWNQEMEKSILLLRNVQQRVFGHYVNRKLFVNLPFVLLVQMMLFGNLEFIQICQLVCKNWFAATRCPVIQKHLQMFPVGLSLGQLWRSRGTNLLCGYSKSKLFVCGNEHISMLNQAGKVEKTMKIPYQIMSAKMDQDWICIRILECDFVMVDTQQWIITQRYKWCNSGFYFDFSWREQKIYFLDNQEQLLTVASLVDGSIQEQFQLPALALAEPLVEDIVLSQDQNELIILCGIIWIYSKNGLLLRTCGLHLFLDPHLSFNNHFSLVILHDDILFLRGQEDIQAFDFHGNFLFQIELNFVSLDMCLGNRCLYVLGKNEIQTLNFVRPLGVQARPLTLPPSTVYFTL